MYVYEGIGDVLHSAGVEHVFGLMGDGNLRFISDIAPRSDMSYYGARHENTAVAMAEGYARATGKLGVCTVTQGPGVTNPLTAIAGARDARTPLLILAGDTPTSLPTNYQAIDQAALFEAAGAAVQPIRSPKTALEDIDRAIRRALLERRPVAVNLTIRVQDSPCRPPSDWTLHPPTRRVVPSPEAIEELVELVLFASRPMIVGGLGAAISGAGPELRELGAQIGALMATSLRGRGLFTGDEFDIGVCGDLSSGLANELIHKSDLVLAFGASLNFWTTCSGELLPQDKILVHCDSDEAAIGRNTQVTYGVVGDARETASLLLRELRSRDDAPRSGQRTPELRAQLEAFRFEDEMTEQVEEGLVDPRFLMLALDRLLPAERTVSIDGGHFSGFPATLLAVPDPSAFLFAVNFGSIGLGLGTALGAAIGRPDRLSVAVVGDGGLMMSLGDLDTAARYDVPLLVVVVNDAAYGAEVHTLDLLGLPNHEGVFNDPDFAAIGAAIGCRAMTVRSTDDLAGLESWLAAPDGPMVVDCKINRDVRANWIEDVIRLQVKARARVRGESGRVPAAQS